MVQNGAVEVVLAVDSVAEQQQGEESGEGRSSKQGSVSPVEAQEAALPPGRDRVVLESPGCVSPEDAEQQGRDVHDMDEAEVHQESESGSRHGVRPGEEEVQHEQEEQVAEGVGATAGRDDGGDRVERPDQLDAMAVPRGESRAT